MTDDKSDIPAEDSIRVICRLRPLNASEEKSGSKFIVKFPQNSSTEDTALSISGKLYVFDKIVKPDATQEYVYNCSAKYIVKDVLNGYNGTIFAYGQTASGKTHTMEGVIDSGDRQGIIPRIIHDIFNHIYTMEENVEFHIKISYYEIYMDKIRDLLDVSKVNLSVHEDKNRVPYVKGATERFVSSPEEVFEVIEEGKANRHIAVTNMNEHSSRSHSVFLINVKQENLENEKKLSGKLYLVDLAGSEKVSKTGAEGTVLDEAKNINKSLSALGNVISALADGVKTHIPYRDSKLTRILQESLGGNARTTIVICCSPASFNECETKSTLEFGRRAKTIKNVVTVNEELTAEEWKRRYEREKEKVIRLRQSLERVTSELRRTAAGSVVGGAKEWAEQILDLISDTLSSTSLNSLSISSSVSASATSLNTSTLTSSQTTGNVGSGIASDSGASTLTRTSNDGTSYQHGQSHSQDEQIIGRLYSQLDDKDDEINQQSELIERLKCQLMDQEDSLAALRRECEQNQQDMMRVQQENDSSRDEVKEVLQALEELAVNYEQKCGELDDKCEQHTEQARALQQNEQKLCVCEMELSHARDSLALLRRRSGELLSSLLEELHELAVVVGTSDVKINTDVGAKIDEEFTMARLYTSKIKSDVKSLVQKCSHLCVLNTEATKKAEESDRELCECRLLIQQHEVKLRALHESAREAEMRRRKLEDSLDSTQEELVALQAAVSQQQTQQTGGDGARDTSDVVAESQEREERKRLEIQLEQHRDTHQRQVSALRDELQSKQTLVEESNDLQQKLVLELEQARADHEQLRSDLEQKSRHIEQMAAESARQQKASEDLRDLEQTVAKELQTLHRLRQMFVADLQSRLKVPPGDSSSQTATGTVGADTPSRHTADKQQESSTQQTDRAEEIALGSGADSGTGSIVQRQKICFLENNLDKLTKIHKQLVRDNADLRCELPKLEKRQQATMERVKALEMALREAKEMAMKDRRRYQHEVDMIRDAVKRKSALRHQRIAQIVKPIRSGQQQMSFARKLE